MQPLAVVDLIDEERQSIDHILEPLVAGEIDLLAFQGLHEAFGLGVVVGVAPSAHRALQAMILELLAIGVGGVL